MEQANKRQRVTKESMLSDIASSIQDASAILTSIGKSHKIILQSNDIIVKYLLEEKQKQSAYEKESNLSATSEQSTQCREETQNTL